MSEFKLPHAHGRNESVKDFHKELLNAEQFNITAEFFKTLSDPTRIRLFWLLCHREECIINLSALLDISSPALSHHIKDLKESKLIICRRDGKEVYYKAADTEVCRLMHHMVEQIMEISCPENSHSNGLSSMQTVHMVHDYLVSHLNERITIDELSKKFLINPTTLKQAFKDEYGTSIAAHTKSHRMEKAAELLVRTKDSVADIAKSVGFESQSKFTCAFKEAYGILPVNYRKTNQI